MAAREVIVVGVGLALLAAVASSMGKPEGSPTVEPEPGEPEEVLPALEPADATSREGDRPMLGSGSSCTSAYLALPRMDRPLGAAVLALMNSAARSYVTPPDGKFIWSDPNGNVFMFRQGLTWLTPAGQVEAFKAARYLLQNPDQRSTIGVMSRRILQLMMPGCDWDRDLWPAFGKVPLSKDEYNLFVSVWYLIQAAARHVGLTVGGSSPWKHLMIPWSDELNAFGGPGLVIGRGFMGLQDWTPGLALEAGRRLQLVVGEYKQPEWPRPPFFHSEPVYARVLSTSAGQPLVELVGTFDGKDVRPKFTNRHGFAAGRRLRLPGPGSATTAIYKIMPKGAM